MAGSTTFEQVNVEKLTPNPRNAKTHSDEQIALIAKSMTEYGFTQPVVIDEDDMILAGHARFLAAKMVWQSRQTIPGNPERSIPVIRVVGLTDIQKRAYMLADNKLPQHSGANWDFNLLRQEAEYLMDDGVNLMALGFSGDDFTLFDGDDANLDHGVELAPSYSPPVARPVYQPQAASAAYHPAPVQPVAPAVPAQTFAPTLNPSASRDQITNRDMEKAAGQMAKQFDGAGRQDLINVVCPHCAKDFNIERT